MTGDTKFFLNLQHILRKNFWSKKLVIKNWKNFLLKSFFPFFLLSHFATMFEILSDLFKFSRYLFFKNGRKYWQFLLQICWEIKNLTRKIVFFVTVKTTVLCWKWTSCNRLLYNISCFYVRPSDFFVVYLRSDDMSLGVSIIT